MHTPENSSLVEAQAEAQDFTLIINEQEYKFHSDEIVITWEYPNVKAQVKSILSAIWTWTNQQKALESLSEVLGIFNGVITKIIQDWNHYRVEKI